MPARARLRRPRVVLPLFLFLFLSSVNWAAGARGDETTFSLCPVAAGNSWLVSCLRDLGLPDECVVQFVPPGSCPGHFDMRPAEAVRIRAARGAFFFDFQANLAKRLRANVLTCEPHVMTPSGGLCVPATYRELASQLRDLLAAGDPKTTSVVFERWKVLDQRLTALEEELPQRVRAAGLDGSPVLSSLHQADFSKWLGLQVVATLPRPDAATPGEIQKVLARARAANVVAIIANLQEGTQAAESLAAALHCPVIVFSNFPALTSEEPDFASLVRRNVERLVRGLAP